MAVSGGKKIVFTAIVIIALGVFLPPNINGVRFKSRLAGALKAAVGRDVTIGSVNFRLLPRPGFDLYDFAIADDSAFNAEPLLLCGKVTADLRLTSLWQGRLEIANLKLQNATDRMPPSLNLVYMNGHWNVESLLVRAEQVATAPTSKKRAEQRPRFPYIEADGGRINIKIGPEKKPYALTETDFAFWLPSEDQWRLRLLGRPIRTDMNLSDTGRIKIEGDIKRSQHPRQTQVKLQLSWDKGQLGQLSKLVLGHDKGWRGSLYLKAELTGPLVDMHLTAQGDLENFRRYDVDRRGMFDISTRCLGQYNRDILDFNCSVPVDSGGIRVSGKFSPLAPGTYDLALVANRVPLSALARFVSYAKRTLPEDLTATGQLDGAFALHARENLPLDWHGTGSTSAFLVSSSLAAEPVQISSIRFHLGTEKPKEAAPALRKRGRAKPIQVPEGRSLIFDPFSIQMGTAASVEVQGSFRSTDYLLAAKGAAPLERILDLGNMTGFHTHITNASGAGSLDLTIHGQWASFAPARLGGTAHVENVTAAVPGIKTRLLLRTVDVHFSDSEVVLITTVQFEHSPVELAGSISKPLNCQSAAACGFVFDLHADTLAIADVAGLLGPSGTRWRLPFLSPSDQLPDFRASGTLALATVTLGELPLEKFIAHLEFGDHQLLISNINARVADGLTQGEWRLNWNAFPIRYMGSGKMTEVSPERLALPAPASNLLTSWMSGKTNLTYSLELAGENARDLFANAKGRGEFTVANGVSRALTLEPGRPTRFQGLEAGFQLNHSVLELLPSKFKAENRIYDVSGTISLADKQAKLKVSNSATQWEITGGLERPHVVTQRLTARQTPAPTP